MTAPAPASPEKASVIEDFVDIFFAPAKVFARRATSSFWIPLLIVTVVIGALTFVNAGQMQGVIDAEFAKAEQQARENNPNMTEQQLEAMRSGMETMSKFTPFFGVIGIPIALLVLGTVVWLAGKVFGSALNWGTGMVIATYAYVPRVLASVLTTIEALVVDVSGRTSPLQFTFSPARFMDLSAGQGVASLMSRLDVFVIWTTILIAIGYMAAGKMEKNKAIVAAVVVFVVGTLPSLPALLRG